MKFIKTKTSDGITFHGLFSESNTKDKIIINVFGMAGNIYLNSYYPFMHEEYPKNGISFLAGENRGNNTITLFEKDGNYINVGNAFEKFEDCVLDIEAWVKFAKELGYKDIWLQGHSLGTSKIAYYLNHTNSNIRGIILLSPSDMIGLVHDEEGIKDHNKLYPEALKLKEEGKANQLLSNTLWGTELLSANTYLNFFSDKSNTAIFNYLNQELGWTVVNNINIPVLAISGTNDDGIKPVIDVKEGMKVLEKELVNSPKKKTIVYEGAKHSFDGFGDQIVNDVISFIN